jgi:hypothetical protein
MSDEDDVRNEIVRAARELIGAHYLAGTYGQCPPYGNDPITARIASRAAAGRTITFMTDRNWRTLAVRAVEINPYRGACLRCCGNYGLFTRLGRGGAVETSELAPTAPITVVRPLLRALYEWYTRIAALPAGGRTEPLRTSEIGLLDYFPRRHTITGDSARKVYFGEDCYGKKHFDCVGFVGYVLTKVLDRIIYIDTPSIAPTTPANAPATAPANAPGSGAINQVGGWQGSGTVHTDPQNCRKGDIFLSARHMALVSVASPNLRLIHADGDLNGVHESGYDPDKWQQNFHVINFNRTFLGLSPS